MRMSTLNAKNGVDKNVVRKACIVEPNAEGRKKASKKNTTTVQRGGRHASVLHHPQFESVDRPRPSMQLRRREVRIAHKGSARSAGGGDERGRAKLAASGRRCFAQGA